MRELGKRSRRLHPIPKEKLVEMQKRSVLSRNLNKKEKQGF